MAALEAAPDTARTVEMRGQTYRIAEKVGLAPLMRFAKVAKQGTDANDMDGLAAMYDLLEQCFADTAEFDRFLDVATVGRWDADEILEVVGKVMEVLAERPTGRSSDSSAGPSSTPLSSAAVSSLRAQRRLEQAGRADLAVAVLERRETVEAQAG
jgi:hypothetical protein